MKTIIVQYDIKWGDPKANTARLSQMIDKAVQEENAQTDLIVLPEMFSTGFATEPEGIAEVLKDNGKTCESLEWMKSQATLYNCAIAGSIAVNDHKTNRYFNRFYFVKPGGEVTFYNKHHLFTYGGEDKRFTPGEKRVIVSWRSVNILLQVCYDLRFPVFARNRLLKDGKPEYDAILYVASWPVSRVEAWSTLLKARAIENQCFVIGVNRVGSDPVCIYPGASAVIDPYGHVLKSCETVSDTSKNAEKLVSANIDMDVLAAFRAKFPVLKDADNELK
jgi:omega-amidase